MAQCTRCRGTGREPDWMALGAKVRQARLSRGYGLREFAEVAGCSPAFLSDVEHGRRGGGLSGKKTGVILKLLGVKP